MQRVEMPKPNTDKPAERSFDLGQTIAYVLWGIFALGAIGGALALTLTPTGGRRLAAIKEEVAAPVAPAPVADNRLIKAEVEQLSADVRRLTNEREKLMARLELLEKSVGEVTGSIPRKSATGVVELEALPIPGIRPNGGTAVAIDRPAGGVAADIVTGAVNPTVTATPDAPATVAIPETTVKHTEFAIDLGGASNLEGLVARWSGLSKSQGKLLTGLEPRVAIRESLGGGVEVRLLAGPFRDAEEAAKVCAVLLPQRQPCDPTVFDGQRLPTSK